MAKPNLVVKVSVRWWVPVYLNTLVALCRIFRTRPDDDKVIQFLVSKGFRITLGN